MHEPATETVVERIVEHSPASELAERLIPHLPGVHFSPVQPDTLVLDAESIVFTAMASPAVCAAIVGWSCVISFIQRHVPVEAEMNRVRLASSVRIVFTRP